MSTRLPPEFRLSPADAVRLLESEVFARMAVQEVPASERMSLLTTAVQDGTVGGRIDDAHIAEVARAAGAAVVITDNRRHFIASLRHGLRVEAPAEFLAGLKGRRA